MPLGNDFQGQKYARHRRTVYSAPTLQDDLGNHAVGLILCTYVLLYFTFIALAASVHWLLGIVAAIIGPIPPLLIGMLRMARHSDV